MKGLYDLLLLLSLYIWNSEVDPVYIIAEFENVNYFLSNIGYLDNILLSISIVYFFQFRKKRLKLIVLPIGDNFCLYLESTITTAAK